MVKTRLLILIILASTIRCATEAGKSSWADEIPNVDQSTLLDLPLTQKEWEKVMEGGVDGIFDGLNKILEVAKEEGREMVLQKGPVYGIIKRRLKFCPLRITQGGECSFGVRCHTNSFFLYLIHPDSGDRKIEIVSTRRAFKMRRYFARFREEFNQEKEWVIKNPPGYPQLINGINGIKLLYSENNQNYLALRLGVFLARNDIIRHLQLPSQARLGAIRIKYPLEEGVLYFTLENPAAKDKRNSYNSSTTQGSLRFEEGPEGVRVIVKFGPTELGPRTDLPAIIFESTKFGPRPELSAMVDSEVGGDCNFDEEIDQGIEPEEPALEHRDAVPNITEPMEREQEMFRENTTRPGTEAGKSRWEDGIPKEDEPTLLDLPLTQKEWEKVMEGGVDGIFDGLNKILEVAKEEGREFFLQEILVNDLLKKKPELLPISTNAEGERCFLTQCKTSTKFEDLIYVYFLKNVKFNDRRLVIQSLKGQSKIYKNYVQFHEEFNPEKTLVLRSPHAFSNLIKALIEINQDRSERNKDELARSLANFLELNDVIKHLEVPTIASLGTIEVDDSSLWTKTLRFKFKNPEIESRYNSSTTKGSLRFEEGPEGVRVIVKFGPTELGPRTDLPAIIFESTKFGPRPELSAMMDSEVGGDRNFDEEIDKEPALWEGLHDAGSHTSKPMVIGWEYLNQLYSLRNEPKKLDKILKGIISEPGLLEAILRQIYAGNRRIRETKELRKTINDTSLQETFIPILIDKEKMTFKMTFNHQDLFHQRIHLYVFLSGPEMCCSTVNVSSWEFADFVCPGENWIDRGSREFEIDEDERWFDELEGAYKAWLEIGFPIHRKNLGIEIQKTLTFLKLTQRMQSPPMLHHGPMHIISERKPGPITVRMRNPVLIKKRSASNSMEAIFSLSIDECDRRITWSVVQEPVFGPRTDLANFPWTYWDDHRQGQPKPNHVRECKHVPRQDAEDGDGPWDFGSIAHLHPGPHPGDCDESEDSFSDKPWTALEEATWQGTSSSSKTWKQAGVNWSDAAWVEDAGWTGATWDGAARADATWTEETGADSQYQADRRQRGGNSTQGTWRKNSVPKNRKHWYPKA